LNASVTLLHVSREGFFFISACMMTYAYYRVDGHIDVKRFWSRRLVAIGVPYLCWTLVYWALGLAGSTGLTVSALEHLGFLVLTGYFQLYFLAVLLQFCIVFPLVAWLLKRTSGHHLALLLGSLAFQVLYTTALHWQLMPGWQFAGRDVLSYQLYLIAGCLTAIHYETINRWFVTHVRLLVLATAGFATLAEGWYWLARIPILAFLGSSSDAFHPIVIPFNLAAIGLIYVAGVGLVSSRRSQTVRRATQVGSDNSYCIYLSQVLFFQLLVLLGWRRLEHVAPWPFAVAGAVVLVFVAGCLLGGTLARTPLALPLAGRHRVSWAGFSPKWLHRRALPVPDTEEGFLESGHPGFVIQMPTPSPVPVDTLVGASTQTESGFR
jgi:peptidoglycan/LPS O-acetylase OafA/YrhL